MHLRTTAALAAATLVLTGCGAEPDKTDVAEENVTVQDTKTPDPSPAESSETPSTGIAAKGKVVFLRCRSCHTLEDGGPHLTGPNLHGLMGATAGKKDGYAYSPALTESNIVWSAETLGKWMEQPRSYIPGNKMVFAGLPKAEDREALVAYLEEQTK